MINAKENIYFIGIGGIGMSALAKYFVANGYQVAGYDKTETKITKHLCDLGIDIYFNDDPNTIPKVFKNKASTLVVYTPAIPKSHKQYNYFKDHHFEIRKRSQVLGDITKNTFCFAVAGTHGKTTTTSILGHLLKECDVKVTAFLGGISENYNSNLIINGKDVTVVEADEFDRSFLTLSPDYACITSVDADHLDIYGDHKALVKSFKDFSNLIKDNGRLFVNNGLSFKGITYGIEDDSDYSAQDISINNGTYHFSLKTPETIYKGFQLQLPGRHNLSNAVVALAMSLYYNLKPKQLIEALKSYKGVKRRFTYHLNNKNIVYIDDYAHHPEEIKAVYQAVREMYPNDKILVVFQPHLYSRTQDFCDAFAKELSKFDEQLLLDIYPARELPIKGVTSAWLLTKIRSQHKKLVTKQSLIKHIIASNARVILTLGAGDIGEQVETIKNALQNEG